MVERNFSIKKLAGALIAATLLSATAGAQADQMRPLRGAIKPLIVAGAPPDSPDARVDPNTADSRFSGVVSIEIISGGYQYICSGALVAKRSVVSAGHCVDVQDNGVVIDLKDPTNRVRVLFNNSPIANSPANAAIVASKVSMHQDYQGFGNCPAGSSADAFCVNDDVAVITLSEDAPKEAKIYKISKAPIKSGTRIIMAGYGTSGNGIDGYNVAPDYGIKRTGQNYMDLFDGDDESFFQNGQEMWYADFDGNGTDLFCDWLGVCTPVLDNDVEANIGGGDSGGPSFIEMYGELMLVGNNTFGTGNGQFGEYFGGMLLGSYADYLDDAAGGRIAFVPEPTGIALFGLGALALFGARRRSIKK